MKLGVSSTLAGVGKCSKVRDERTFRTVVLDDPVKKSANSVISRCSERGKGWIDEWWLMMMMRWIEAGCNVQRATTISLQGGGAQNLFQFSFASSIKYSSFSRCSGVLARDF
jgi:hypothetical protein